MTDIQVAAWEDMEYDELKIAVAHAIMGQGMGGSSQYLHFIPDYFDKIRKQKIKDDVLKIISELARDIEMPVSSRAVYILGQLPIQNIKSLLLAISQMLDPILDKIFGVGTIPESCMKYLDLICEINKAISKFNIVEGRPFLEKQIKHMKRVMPLPVTNEYYVYMLSSKSALDSLKVVDPVLAKKYL